MDGNMENMERMDVGWMDKKWMEKMDEQLDGRTDELGFQDYQE